MKINKIILSGIILILFGGLLFISDVLTPFIRPITYLFLMGSSKGKDILFFTLFGLFLILSQIYKIKSFKFKANNFLLISIIIAFIILTIAILLEVYLRLKLGININTIFVNINPSFSTTSILHTHLPKSIIGKILTTTINPLIGSNINTGVSLYSYVSSFSIPLLVLIVLLFFTEILALQKKKTSMIVLLSFFEILLFIGCFDGGIMGTPGALGLFGCIWIYIDEKNILLFGKELKDKKNPIKALKSYIEKYERNKPMKDKLKRYSPYIIGLIIILLRLSISILGANPEFYEVNIFNPADNVNLTNQYPIEYIDISDNKITYHMDSYLNEHDLTNNLHKSLNNSCDYYTVSWNFYSYI